MNKTAYANTNKTFLTNGFYPVETLTTFLSTQNENWKITNVKNFIMENWGTWCNMAIKDFLDYWNLGNVSDDDELLYINEDYKGDPFVVVYEDLQQMTDKQATEILHKCGYGDYRIIEDDNE